MMRGLFGLRLGCDASSSFYVRGVAGFLCWAGKGNGLSASDWGNWLTGKNADTDDKWNDIGGFDFRLRYGDFQVYGEAMGEDQAGRAPVEVGVPHGAVSGRRFLQMAHGSDARGGEDDGCVVYALDVPAGWTYSGDIMGDDMGNDARK